MAIFRANYVTKGMREKATAKANIRYIENRPGKDGEKLHRTLFTAQGAIGRYEAYQMIDAAEQHAYLYRIVISPDRETEDTHRDLSLREITERVMYSLGEVVDSPIAWVGVIQADHSPHRHVHALAVMPRRLQKYELSVMIHSTTELCGEQRRELDLIRERTQNEREGDEWERER